MTLVATHLITAEDVLRCDSPYRDCEIWDGTPMLREPSGGEAEFVAAEVVGPLREHVRARGLGWTFLSSQGFLVSRDPDRLLASDGAFVSRARLPRLPKRGFIELAPDFLIEVRSPDDTWETILQKCGVWVSHGAACVWAIDPFTRTIAEFRPARTPVIHRDGLGTATADPVLPGFSIALPDLFAELGDPAPPDANPLDEPPPV